MSNPITRPDNTPNCNTGTTSVLEKIGKFKDLLTSGQAILVDDTGNPLKKASERVGFGTQSLLEQWRDSYGNGDYDVDPYDDDMYEGQDLTQELQAICDNLDIRVRGWFDFRQIRAWTYLFQTIPPILQSLVFRTQTEHREGNSLSDCSLSDLEMLKFGQLIYDSDGARNS
ncbi:hypothetical protein Tco_1337489 [Tanacetum coccineum]